MKKTRNPSGVQHSSPRHCTTHSNVGATPCDGDFLLSVIGAALQLEDGWCYGAGCCSLTRHRINGRSQVFPTCNALLLVVVDCLICAWRLRNWLCAV
jgi:hypothetical protein